MYTGQDKVVILRFLFQLTTNTTGGKGWKRSALFLPIFSLMNEIYLLCRMTMHSGMLAEVLSDWGLLELLLGELRRRAKILRKAGIVSPHQISMN